MTANPAPLQTPKLELIDFAFRNFPIRSFVDLGCIWGVEGGYTFYTLDRWRPDRAWMVDWRMPPGVRERAAAYPQLNLEVGYFSSRSLRDRIGHVDAVFLFDVLLHQVNPDWHEVVASWSEVATYLLVVNQQWNGERSVRLLDLGQEEYFANVPHRASEPPYDDLFSKLDDPHPIHQRAWRDVHSIWQWGITDRDLLQAAGNAGLELHYFANLGQFGDLEAFTVKAFLFGPPHRGLAI